MAVKSAKAMMPIVFWASLLPWLKPRNPALKICSGRNVAFIFEGVNRDNAAKSTDIQIKPMTKPSTGELIIGITTL